MFHVYRDAEGDDTGPYWGSRTLNPTLRSGLFKVSDLGCGV